MEERQTVILPAGIVLIKQTGNVEILQDNLILNPFLIHR
jgi:hypothetical protein